MERLSISQVCDLLGFKDARTVEKWCNNHGVVVLSDTGTKTRYVLKVEFEAARLKALIGHLKVKHGKKWFEFFSRYMTHNVS